MSPRAIIRMGHKSQAEIRKQINKISQQVMIGGRYVHYKNPRNLYMVEFVGCREDTEEVCVGYRALYGKGILWIRTAENFLSEVEKQGKTMKRFELVK